MSFVIKGLFVISVIVLLLAAPLMGDENEGDRPMNITSPEFKHNGFIPKRFTCQGEDINPALSIEGIPENTMSLVLIVDDPDASMGTWVHWVLYNVPVASEIKENSIPGKQGINDFGRGDYGGPCPPSGTHRYFFKVYALDIGLKQEEGMRKIRLLDAMEGHVIQKAELIGLYKKH